jgi:hypothetical protein
MLECGWRNVCSKEGMGVKRETVFPTYAPLRCAQGFGPQPRKQGMAVHLCGKIAVLLTALHDILNFGGYLQTESAPNAEPDVAAQGLLLRVSRGKRAEGFWEAWW